MNHEESRLQQQCVAWFRAQYPQYAMLLTHPANEGNGNRVSGAIHKAEGTVAGVPDLVLFMPYVVNIGEDESDVFIKFMGVLGIEFKTSKGRQSQSQKDFEKMFSAAGNAYIVVRSIDEFRSVVNEYLEDVPLYVKERVSDAYRSIAKAADEREKEKFYKVIGKK